MSTLTSRQTHYVPQRNEIRYAKLAQKCHRVVRIEIVLNKGYVVLVAVGHSQVLYPCEDVVLNKRRVDFKQLIVHGSLHLKQKTADCTGKPSSETKKQLIVHGNLHQKQKTADCTWKP